MKNLLLSVLFVMSTIFVSAQDLTLSELQNLCKQTNWSRGIDILTNKGWTFDSSKVGNATNYSLITYAYGKDNNGHASAWFYFYVYNNIVEKIGYTSTEKAYKNIKAALTTNGYSLTDNSIDKDNSITTIYENRSYRISICTQTIKDDYTKRTFVVNDLILFQKNKNVNDATTKVSNTNNSNNSNSNNTPLIFNRSLSDPIIAGQERFGESLYRPDAGLYGKHFNDKSVYDDDLVDLRRLNNGWSVDDLRREQQKKNLLKILFK